MPRPWIGASGDVLAGEGDRAGIRALEPGDRAQRRGLAGGARTQDGEELAGRDLEVDAGERLNLAVALDEAPDGQLRHGSPAPCIRRDRTHREHSVFLSP